MSLNTSLRDILDEEGTLVKSVYQKVTFHQSGCSIQDPVSRKSWWWASEFLGIEKLIYFSLIRRKQKLTRTLLHCSVEDFLTAWMSSTLSGQWLWIPARQCSVTPRKSHASVSTTKHSDFIAADEWASYSSDLNPLDYCIWDILRIRVWCTKADDFHLQVYKTRKRQSKTNGMRSPLRQFENPLHNGKKTTECG